MAKPAPAYLIRLGRAYVRLIEAADVLLEAKFDQQDIPQAACPFARRMLRGFVEDAEPAVAAETPAPTVGAVSRRRLRRWWGRC